MQQQFSRNIILLLAINFLIKPFYILGIDAQVQNAVGPSAYGMYFALFNFCFLFQIILDLGIQNFNSKNVSENREQVAQIFPFVFGAKIMLALAFVVVVFAFGLLTGYTVQNFLLLCLLSLIMIFQSMYNYLRSHFSALGMFRTETWLSALDKLLMILLIGYLIYLSQSITIIRFAAGQVIALVMAVIIAVFLLRRHTQIRIRFSWQHTVALLKKTFPFALVFLLMTLYTRMDGVMLEMMLDDEAVSAGIYAAAYRLLDGANMLGYLFAVLLLPMFAHILNKKEEVKALVQNAFALMVSMNTLIALLCWFFGEEIIYLIYPAATDEYVQVFRILMIGFWAMSASYVYGSLITASGKLRWFNWIFVVGIMLNWSLNILLIPSHGALGAAIATLSTQFVVFGGQVILANKMFDLRYSARYLIKCITIVGTYFAIVYGMARGLELFWMIELLMASVFCLAISFFLGFFRLSLSHDEV